MLARRRVGMGETYMEGDLFACRLLCMPPDVITHFKAMFSWETLYEENFLVVSLMVEWQRRSRCELYRWPSGSSGALPKPLSICRL